MESNNIKNKIRKNNGGISSNEDNNATPLSNLSVQERLHLAEELESRLRQSSNNKDNVRNIRVQLCEHLSDIILSHPDIALKEDCLGRLWHGCFYQRIQELRGLISKEKKKENGNAGMYEESLKVFLDEAIKLYEFLDKRLKSLLTHEDKEDGLVPCLYRLYIHLGDLLRYSNANHTEVEKTYLKASKLSPGRGNPYNQLAVVAQQHVYPRTCIALYWYARALLASVEPFQTSRSNLTRLFTFNKTCIESHPLEQDKMRRFMADFIDFHSIFLTDKMDKQQDPDFLKNKTLPLFQNTFSSLLEEQSLSDGLLVKMSAIFIFSTLYKGYKKLSFDSMIIFAKCIASQLRSSVSKFSNVTESTPSIRMIVPLILLCEWVNTLNVVDSSEFDDFCESLASLANCLYCNIPEKLLGDPSSKLLWIDQDFEGFSPLHPYVKGRNKNLDGFLSPKQAAEVLGIDKNFPPKTCNDNSLKIGRFLRILRSIAQKNNPLLWDPSIKRFSTQSSTGIDITAVAPSFSPAAPLVAPTAIDEDDCDDEIVYMGAETSFHTSETKVVPMAIKPPPGFSRTPPPPDTGFILPIKSLSDNAPPHGVIGGSPLIGKSTSIGVLPPPPPPGFDQPLTSNPFVNTGVKLFPPPGFHQKIELGKPDFPNKEETFLGNRLGFALPPFPAEAPSFPFPAMNYTTFLNNNNISETTKSGNTPSSEWPHQQSLNFDACNLQPPPATKNPFFM